MIGTPYKITQMKTHTHIKINLRHCWQLVSAHKNWMSRHFIATTCISMALPTMSMSVPSKKTKLLIS